MMERREVRSSREINEKSMIYEETHKAAIKVQEL